MSVKRHAWQTHSLMQLGRKWFTKQRRKMHRVSEKSPWWHFVGRFPQQMADTVQQIIHGSYRFSPMKAYCFNDELLVMWDYMDRFALHLLWVILLPMAKKILPSRSYHLQGGMKKCLRDVEKTLKHQRFGYVMRLDIKSFYASIDHKILLKQLATYISDPILLGYLEQVVTIPIDRNADIRLPSKGIPIRSSLSPFFGGIYLLPLLNALQQRKGCEAFLFMDDLLVFIKTKSQLRRAKKVLFQVLKELKLKLSAKKSKISPLDQFHLLGVSFRVSQNHENKNTIRVQLHARSCTRALDKVNAMSDHTVHPAKRQNYLAQWGKWWASVLKPISYTASLQQWVAHALSVGYDKAAWLARGLLPWRLACFFTLAMRDCTEIGL